MSRTNPRLRPPLPLPPLPQSRRPRRIPPLLRSRRGPPRLLPRLPLFFVSVDSRGAVYAMAARTRNGVVVVLVLVSVDDI